MKCPFCLASDSRVVDSREQAGGAVIRRRRECLTCSRRFTTYERFETTPLIVVKKDKRREPYSHEKLVDKLRIALTKRPVSEDEIDAVVAEIEAELLRYGVREIPSAVIGEAVLRHLKSIDEVAYIRFASVYREFGDLNDIRREVEDLGDHDRTS